MRAIVVHAAAWEDVGRIGVDTMPWRLAGQLVRPGIARSRLWEAAADAARCSAPVVAAAQRSPTFPRSCCAAGCMSRRPGARRGLSECPDCARSAGRPGLASSSSGAGLRRAQRRRHHAPLGPDAGWRGSIPAFQSRRRESEAQRRPPAAGPHVGPTTICFPYTSAACRPLDLSRSYCPASLRRIWEVRQRRWGRSSCFLRQSMAANSPRTPWRPRYHVQVSSSAPASPAKPWR